MSGHLRTSDRAMRWAPCHRNRCFRLSCMFQMFCRMALRVALALAVPATAWAQAPLPELSLEELMALDAGQVYGASERLQPVTEAPASVSFITADEIARFGYRTLADILRSVRGMYVSDDRNFSLVGVRGFGKPGDYNSRILLLVNGHRVNDNVFGQAEIGAEFGMDPATFERVEVLAHRLPLPRDALLERGEGHAFDLREHATDVVRVGFAQRRESEAAVAAHH